MSVTSPLLLRQRAQLQVFLNTLGSSTNKTNNKSLSPRSVKYCLTY
nr:MAG TPA: hypothetical protein [Caudoviricetes sp.]